MWWSGRARLTGSRGGTYSFIRSNREEQRPQKRTELDLEELRFGIKHPDLPQDGIKSESLLGGLVTD